MTKLQQFPPQHLTTEVLRVEIGQVSRRDYGYRVVWKDKTTSAWFTGYTTFDGARSAGKAW